MKLALVTSLMILAAGAVSAQPSFPRVDPGVQAARDTDRQAILLQEREEESKVLQSAEKALASGAPGEKDKLAAAVDRHRKNLASLNAEIQRAGGGAAPAVAVAAAGPVRLKAASAAPDLTAADTPAPYWDVYRRQKPSSPQVSEAATVAETVPYGDVHRTKKTKF